MVMFPPKYVWYVELANKVKKLSHDKCVCVC